MQVTNSSETDEPKWVFSPPKEPDPHPVNKAFVRKLTLLVLLALIATFWLLKVTDYFEDAVKLFALGGILSLIAVVQKFIPEERSKQLQSVLYDRFWRLNDLSLGAILACFAASTFFIGSIEVTLNAHAAAGPFSINDETEYLSTGKATRILYWTSPFATRVITLRAFGYPDNQFTISPWTVTEAHIPDSIKRPVLLLIPSPELFRIASQSPFPSVTLLHAGTPPVVIPKYDGRAIWIGCDERVDVPLEFLDYVRAILNEGTPRYFQFVFGKPTAFPTPGPRSQAALPTGATTYRLECMSNQLTGYAPCTDIEWPPHRYSHMGSIYWEILNAPPN